MPHISKLHLLVGMKIAIPVLPSIGAYISDDARSSVNYECFDLLSFSNRKFRSEKKSDVGDFAPSRAKTAALYEKLVTLTSRGILRQIF